MARTLKEKATLVSLTLRKWQNEITDERVTEQADKANKATNAGRYKKNLVRKEAMKAIQTAYSALRTNFYLYTLAWGDNGERVLPGSLMFEFKKKHNDLKVVYDTEVEAFCINYPSLKEQAKKFLGDMYNEHDYPSVANIRSKFGVYLDWGTFPDKKDFRLTSDKEMAEEIRREIEESLTRKQKEVAEQCWTRMKVVVQKIHERISDEDNVFHDTLIENAREQCKLLAHMNLTEDPEIEAVRKEVESFLIHPQRLREDKTLRADKAKEAADILKKMGIKV